jgi:cytochrome b subunit of formate dehydrogenase
MEDKKIDKECPKLVSRKAIKMYGERHIERYSFLERLAHFAHLTALFVLLITGFKIYMGWEFITYHAALNIHMAFAIIFMVANWIIIPYNIITTECPHCEICDAGGIRGYSHRAMHIARRYLFGPTDAKRVKQILLNYLGKAPYPAYTVFDVKNRGYIDKLHPMTKFLLVFEGAAVGLVFISGIPLYHQQWELLGIPIGHWILLAGDMIGPYFNLGTLALIRTVHLLVAYFFIIEVTVHVGIIELDPKIWKFHKAIFWTGTSDLCDYHYVDIINVDDDEPVAQKE